MICKRIKNINENMEYEPMKIKYEYEKFFI